MSCPEGGGYPMSLHPQATYPIPEDTQRVARAAFPHGNIYMPVADRLGNLYNDAQFTTHVLAAIRVLNRLERVGETLRAALNSLAVVAPAWVQTLAPLEWYERYGHRVENYQLPKTDAARQALAAAMGADGQQLLQAID